MINKQGLWFLTLFSLVLVLSVYYITMPNEVFTNSIISSDTSFDTETVNKEVSTSNYLATLKIELEEKRNESLKKYESILSDSSASTSDKNSAYEGIKNINSTKAMEESLVSKIKNELSLNSFVEVDSSKVVVVVDKKDHDVKLANKIMNLVQDEFSSYVSVSVKFSK
jgi:stage III sporulation protein AH